jgi:hypothetical protein
VPLGSRRFFVVHWPGATSPADPAAQLRSIERFHVQTNRWAVSGYNFAVSRDGRIFEGCGESVRGIHSPPRNVDGFGVCVLINVGERPPAAALNSTRALYDHLCRRTGRELNRSWHAADQATACPGPDLIGWVRDGMRGSGGGIPPAPPPPRPNVAPPFPGRLMINRRPMMHGADIRQWQQRMRERTWNIMVDGWYGPQSAGVARQFQTNHRLMIDGIVGPQTWRASWEIPVR